MLKSKRSKKSKTGFGRLLQEYRQDYDMTQTELAQALAMHGYNISISAINRYEFGQRTPPPEFIVRAAQCLHLSQEQEAALLDACLSDYRQDFYAKYRDALKRLNNP